MEQTTLYIDVNKSWFTCRLTKKPAYVLERATYNWIVKVFSDRGIDHKCFNVAVMDTLLELGFKIVIVGTYEE